MQNVEGSSPFIRLKEPARNGGFFYGLSRYVRTEVQSRLAYTPSVRWIAVGLAVLVLMGCGGETAEQQAPPLVASADDIVTLMGTPRLTSLSSAGEDVIAEGQATAAAGDSTRTDWFQIVGAVEYAQHFGGSYMVRKVFNGTTLINQEKDDVGTLADEVAFYSEQDFIDYAEQHADAAGVVVEEVNYVPLLGGTAEFVLRPTDESEFLAEADLRLIDFLDDLHSKGGRPSLVTIVNSAGANRLVQGSVPTSDGTNPVKALSIGMSWAAEDIHIWDRSTGAAVEASEPVSCDDPAAPEPPCPGG